jgi:hypothetical protein
LPPFLRRAWPIGLVILYGLVLASTAGVSTPDQPVPAFPLANLFDKPLGEDGFYMLSVARSLAEGAGLTYGGVPTTGIQPMATIIYAAIYWLSDAAGLSAEFPLRAVIVFNVLVLVAVGVMSGRLVEARLGDAGRDSRNAAWIVATIFVVNAGAFRLFTYGLESGIYLALLAALQLAIHKGRGPLIVGGLMGLCFLARLDFALLTMAVVGYRLVTRRLSIADAIRIGLVAALVAAPWMWHVNQVMHSWMPSSGASQSALVDSAAQLAARAWHILAAAVIAMSGVLYLPILNPVINAMVVAGLGAVIGVAIVTLRGYWSVALRDQAPWLLGSAVLAGYYLAASGAVHFYPRYLAPFWLFWTQALGAVVVLVANERRPLPKPARLLAPALVGLFAVQIGFTLHRGAVSNTHLHSAFYIARNEATLGVVGAFQSGVVGYLTHERTVNLDGKLDGRALAWRDAHRLECYLAERRITTLIDWEANIYNGWIDPAFVRTKMRQIDRIPGGASVVMRVDAAGLDCGSEPPRPE